MTPFRKAFICLVSGFLLLAAAATRAEEPAQSPDAFLQKIYARYAPDQEPLEVQGDDANWIFENSLLTLIRQDQEQAKARDEVPLMDGDPICNCQEYDELKDLRIDVADKGNGTASADVSFVNYGEQVKIKIDLLRVGGAWKIFDITDSSVGSLRDYLAKGLTEGESL